MIDVIVIGTGQQGLSASFFLSKRKIDHIVLEKHEIGSHWKSLWDSFQLNTPNKYMELPGKVYQGGQPDFFSTKEEVISFLESYASEFDLPVRCGVEVLSVQRKDAFFLVQTSVGLETCRALIVATGSYGRPYIPTYTGRFPEWVSTIHSREYKNPDALRTGGVLVVGGGQTGVQIAEELRSSGREVFWCFSGRPCNLRRISNWDFMELWERGGLLHQKLEENSLYLSESTQSGWSGERAASDLFRMTDSHNARKYLRSSEFPLVSGKGGDGLGHSINLKEIWNSGITLVGRLREVWEDRAYFSDSLHDDVEASHQGTREIYRDLESIAAKLEGSHVSIEDLELDWAWRPPYELKSLNLRSSDIGTTIFATGFRRNLDWLEIPGILDSSGYPLGRNGVSPVPGLYFLGLFFLQRLSSTCLCNGGRDAAETITHLATYLQESELSQKEINKPSRHQTERNLAQHCNSTAARHVVVLLPTMQDYKSLKTIAESSSEPVVLHFLQDTNWSHFMQETPTFRLGDYAARAITYSRQHGISAAFYSHDQSSLAAAAVCSDMTLPGPSVESILLACHKYYSRSVDPEAIKFAAQDLWSNKWTEAEYEFPVFIKPATLNFSVLQRKVDTKNELLDALNSLRANLPAWSAPISNFFTRFGDLVKYPLIEREIVLIEEFVDAASQHAVEGWTDGDGQSYLWAISDNNYFGNGPGPLDSNIVPSRLPKQTQQKLLDLAFLTIRRHGIRFGFWNVEIWIGRDGAQKVTEVNSRAVASMSILYDNVYKKSHYRAMLSLALGNEAACIDETPTSPRCIGGMFSIPTYGKGQVKDFLDFSKIPIVKNLDGVVGFASMQHQDYEIRWSQTGGAFCLARVYLVGASEEEIVEIANRIRHMLLLRPDLSPWN